MKTPTFHEALEAATFAVERASNACDTCGCTGRWQTERPSPQLFSLKKQRALTLRRDAGRLHGFLAMVASSHA
jgi:hypothetical protein